MANGQSRLARALWIEICGRISRWSRRYASRLARALWIEIGKQCPEGMSPASRLARALWIEIFVIVPVFTLADCRGSREPCGLKSLMHCPVPAQWQVEARESLVD